MKRIVCLLCLQWICLPGTAVAAGGGQPQGTLLAGVGIDWQRTATEFQPLSVTKPPKFVYPPPPGTRFRLAAAYVVVDNCDPPAGPYTRCAMTVYLAKTHKRSFFCGKWLGGQGQRVWMYVLNGYAKFGVVAFHDGTQDPRELTFACAAQTTDLNELRLDKQMAAWDALGAIGKCILWPPNTNYGVAGKFQPATQDLSRRFTTCVRAARADYCGDGVTYTKDRTPIFLFEGADAGAAADQAATMRRSRGYLYEANWDENGALCVIHSRYQSLDPVCQGKFKQTKVVDGQEYRCKSSSADLQQGVLKDDSTLRD